MASCWHCLNICLFKKKTLLALIAALGSILAQRTFEVSLAILSIFIFRGLIFLLYNRHGLLWKHLKLRPYKLLQRPEGETFSPPSISECTCWLVKCNALACSGAGPADTTCESGTLHLDKTTISCRIYFFPSKEGVQELRSRRGLQMSLQFRACSAAVLS